ncbi:MAG: GNAT family N-acetyltransferase [Methanospirillum sp.]
MAWTVRPFSDADFPAVWALERVRDAEGYASAVTVRQAAALWPATLLVADEDGEVVGFTLAAASSDPAVGWILRLKVREDRRRQGCATALLRAALERLRDDGVRVVRLTVAPANEPARSLYARLGFVEEALLPDYFGPGEDRLQLHRRIDPLPACVTERPD